MRNSLNAMMEKLGLHESPRVKKTLVGVIGGTVLLTGICLIVLPGPAFLVIPAGLAILATEFVWARCWLQKTRAFLQKVGNLRKK